MISLSRRAPRFVAAAGVLALMVAAPAGAASSDRSLVRAERVAKTAVAPLSADGTQCYRLSRSPRSRRAVCLVAHPAGEGQICRSLVRIDARGRAKVLARNVCGPEFGGPSGAGAAP